MLRGFPGEIAGNSQYGDFGNLCNEFLEVWSQNQLVTRILGVALPFHLEQHPVALSHSANELEQLIGEQGDDAEHEVQPDFFCPPNHDVASPEIFFQPAVKPLGNGPFPVAGRLMRRPGEQLLSPASFCQ